MNAKVQHHPTTCPRCETPNTHRGRRELVDLVRVVHAKLEKAVQDADHRRYTRESMTPVETALYEAETTIQLIEAVQAAARLMRRDLYAIDGGCLKCLDALKILAPERCSVCGSRGPGVGPEQRCPVLGCAGSLA